MFVTPAFAQTIGGASDLFGQLGSTFVPLILIFAVMYFMVLRPQRQKALAHQEKIKNVRRGDTIVTAGGLIGRIVKAVDENEVLVEIAENTNVRIARPMITEIRAKGEPVKEAKGSTGKEEERG